jgi:hypothetical protein
LHKSSFAATIAAIRFTLCICDHRYCWGTLAGDRSGWHSDGTSYNVQPLAEHAGLNFPFSQSRIVIQRKEPWLTLTGIRIEVVTRLNVADGWLVDGGDSFALYLHQGELVGYGYRRDCTISTSVTTVTVPLDRWVRLTFEHNGFNAMALFIDDVTVATGPAIGFIPGVEPPGVFIGNGIGVPDGHLHGDIQSVKIWRVDPRAMEREFFARPISPEVADCWARFFRELEDALRNDPDCAGRVATAINALENDFKDALKLKSQPDINEFNKMCKEYRLLWRAGALGGRPMREFAARFRAWLIAKGLLNPADPKYQTLVDSPCAKKILEHLSPLTCDPQVMVLLRHFAGDPQPPAHAPRS